MSSYPRYKHNGCRMEGNSILSITSGVLTPSLPDYSWTCTWLQSVSNCEENISTWPSTIVLALLKIFSCVIGGVLYVIIFFTNGASFINVDKLRFISRSQEDFLEKLRKLLRKQIFRPRSDLKPQIFWLMLNSLPIEPLEPDICYPMCWITGSGKLVLLISSFEKLLFHYSKLLGPWWWFNNCVSMDVGLQPISQSNSKGIQLTNSTPTGTFMGSYQR